MQVQGFHRRRAPLGQMNRKHRTQATASSACAPQEFNTRCQYYGDALSYITQYAFKNPKSPFLVRSPPSHTQRHTHASR